MNEATTTTASSTADRVSADAGVDRAYRDMHTRLRSFIARRVEDPDTAEDLTQEVMLRLIRSGSTGELDDPMAWLYRVARNVIIDHYRSRRPAHPVSDPDQLTHPAIDPFADDPRAARHELAHCVRSLVDRLAEPYRSAVHAVDLDGVTHAKVADAIGLSTPGVKSRVQRGRRQLRDLLIACCTLETSAAGTITGYTAPPDCNTDSTCAG